MQGFAAPQGTRFEGINPDLHGTTHAYPADVRFPDVGFDPARLRIVNNEQRRIGGIAPHQAPRLDIALPDDAINRAANDRFCEFQLRRFDLGLGFFVAGIQHFETLLAQFVFVHVNVGDKGIETNFDVAERYGIPLKKGVPALAVLEPDGRVIYAQKTGEFEAMRKMEPKSVNDFLVRWSRR